jgi:two-component system nitrate/nitrite response regulator NarL
MTNNPNPIRIVIADEHSALRRDLRHLLESEPSLHVVGEASDCDRTLQLIHQVGADVVLIDFALIRPLELTMLNGSRDNATLVRFVVMVTAIEKAQLVDAFRFGAHGIVLKNSTPRVLLNSLQSVIAGHYWLGSESVTVLVEALHDSWSRANDTKSPKDYGLTPREVEIMTKIAKGSSNREVGENFSISERTVKHHLTNIFSKVGVSSRLQLALFAVNHRLMSNPGPSLSIQSLGPDDGTETGAR